MHILAVLDTYPALSETFLYTTILTWQKVGIQVRLLARKRGKAFHEIPFQARVRYLPSETASAPVKLGIIALYFLRLSFSPQKLKSALRCLRHGQGLRQKLQLAYRCFPLFYYQTELVYFPFGGLAVKYLEYILETDARVVFSLRGSDIHFFPVVNQQYRERLKQALLAADGVHCVCSEISERVRELTGGALPKAKVIYTSMAEEIYKSSARHLQDKPVVEIISVGRLEWVKGLEHGIVAAQALMQSGVDFRWRIIGDGDYRLLLQWAIRDMGLQGRVFLTGPVKHSDVVQALQTADIFFHPSIHEGISNAVLEAMALGLPVVASEVGGMREAVPSDAYGLLVPPRDWKCMADALERLAKDGSLRAQIGASASAYVRSRFTAKEQTDGFLALFQTAASQQETA